MSALRARKSSKPLKSKRERRDELADSISSNPENIAMVACTACVNEGVVCYYDREQSVKCAECLRHQRDCDGTFSLEEFRRVGEQKKELREKSRRKRKEIARLRRVLLDAQAALASAEEADNETQDSLAALERQSERMLQREMQALGVFNNIDSDSSVALAEPDFTFQGVVTTDSIDWDGVFLDHGADQSVPG